MADNYWDRFTKAATSLGKRYFEQSGIPDIVEELARFDDPDMSLADYMRTAGAATMQTLTAPLQGLGYLAVETNRALGAGALSASRVASGSPDKALEPWYNYATSWTPPSKQIRNEDGTYQQAQGVYHAPTAGELILVADDRIVSSAPEGLAPWAKLLLTAPAYQTGTMFVPSGQFDNGSYIPPGWDIYAADAGSQINESDLRYAALGSDMITEAVVDPLNYLMAPISAALKGRTLLHGGQAVKGLSTSGSAAVRMEDLIDAAKMGTIRRRIAQTRPGIGMWDQSRYARELVGDPGMRQTSAALAANKDFGKALEFYTNPMLGLHPTAAAELAKASVYLDSAEDIMHLHMATSYRNVASVDRVRQSLSISSPDLANTLDDMLGLGDNVIEQAMVDFPNGTQLPTGHVLSQYAKSFLDNALMQHPEAKKAWDGLADEVRSQRLDAFSTKVESVQKDMGERWALLDQMFGEGRVDQILPNTLTGSASKRAATRAGLIEPSTFSQALTGFTSKVHVVPGGVRRFGMKHLLMAKPGLVFDLDAADSGDKFNDLINYASNVIGNGRGIGRWGAEGSAIIPGSTRTISNRLPVDYAFAMDPEVIRMRNAFFDAATTTSNPGMLRASIVDELQQYALTKIAESSGFEPEVAQYLAKMGMDRGRNISAALNSADNGFSTVILEDGVPLVLTNHPTTAQQGANVFVPIMDLAGVRKAMHSAPMRAYTDPDSLISIAKIDKLEKYGVKSKITGTQNLKAFGRTQTPIGSAYHGMVDLLDVANNFFKMWVLLRLGYPVRNLTEGYLATVGSGVGMMKTLGHTEGVLGNLGYNWGFVGSRAYRRLSDKMMTVAGFRANETALAATLEKSNAALQISTDHISDMIDAVTDPNVIDALIRVATNPKSTPLEVERANASLAYLSELKHRLATPIERSMVADRFADTTSASQRLYHSDMTGAMPIARDVVGRPLEIEAGVTSIPTATKLSRPLSMTPFSANAQGKLDEAWTPFTMSNRAVGSVNPRPGWAKKRIRSEAGGKAQWEEAMDYFESILPTHHIEYRTGPDAMWKTFRTPKPAGKYRKYNHGSSQKWEFRVRPKGAEAVPPKVIGVDTYGKQIDLRGGYGKQAILDNYRDIDGSTIDAAMAGDRAMQEKLSEQLANHGVYRVVFDDAPEWGGVNVLVHPKGLGTDGLRAAVKDDVNAMIADRMAAMPAPGPVLPKGRRGQQRAWNKGVGHGLLQERVEHIDPGFPFRLSDVLRDGGFDDILEEAIQQHVALKRQNVGLRTALQQRKARVGEYTKRAGTPYMNAAYRSDYGESYLTDSMLNGIDGYKFRQITSGDATVQSTIGFALQRGDQVDNLRASYLKPRDILPNDPDYFEGLSNLMNRFYADTAGAVESRSTRVLANPSEAINLDHIDPVMLRALASGDRQRLYEETVKWALTTAEGRNWVRTIGLQPPGSDFASDAVKAERAANAAKRNVRVDRTSGGAPTRQATRELTGQQHVPYRQKGFDHRSEVDVENVIADHFNFADNFLLSNPRVADLFLSGEMTPATLRALYDEAPWELKPFNGAMAPTSAESKQMLRDMYAKRDALAGLTEGIQRMMSSALQKIGSNPETRLLRHPVFEAIAQQDMQQRVAAAEQMLGRRVSAAELYDLSERSRVFAARRMKETLYTLESRSTMDDYLRFVSPFFPAWFNTASRWGRFYRRNPAGPAKIASRWITLSNSGMIVDSNGNEVSGDAVQNSAFQTYLLLPVGIGSFGPVQKMFPGAEEAMSATRIPMRAWDVIFQGDPTNPGFGPVIGMPMQFFLEDHDELYQNEVGRFLIEKILPVGHENTGNRALDVVYPWLPTGLKRTLDEVFDTNKVKSQFSTCVMLLATERIKGQYEGDDAKLLDDAKKLSLLMSRVKVASALISPVAQQQQGYQDFIAGQWREIQDFAYAAGQGDKADEMFLKMYPADFLLTLSSSIKLTGAQQTAYATANQDQYKDLQRLAITSFKDPGLLWFQDNYRETEDGQGAIDQYQSEDFNPYSRVRQFNTSPAGTNEPYIQMREPEEMYAEGMERLGWVAYNKAKDEVTARLVAQGYPEGSYEFLKKQREWMAATSEELGKANEVWWKAYSTGPMDTAKYEKRADFFRALVTNAEWMRGKEDHELPQLLTAYLDARDAAIVEMEALGKAKTTSAKANSEIAARLELKAMNLGKNSASFRLWYDRYFRNDVVNVDEDNGEQP